ncbi:MAG TPA: OmpA family protein [Bryobacteraceae bacterium]|nr:OmpA family protein [Bryobacteraceae bacterium]
MIMQKAVLMSTAAAGLMLFSTGCATKRHVRTAIAPVENRVGAVEKRTTQAEADVDALEKQLSQTTEIASGADRDAKLAKEMANTADGKAVAAGQRADSANALAEKSMARIGEVETSFGKSLDNLYENVDNYQMSRSESITFGFNRADLTKEMKEKLDSFAATVKDQKKFVVEVQGFADPVGNLSYNQELSQRRAMTVARYLSVEHEIPLRRIQMLGVGSVKPVADNKTREGRMQNRRVEVKIYTLPASANATPAIAKSL